ncbi:hypothetical protein RRG08_055634 [Elysia crispata]|uniref:Uncharacterized protein n=1 Tax=Elysia crispata TaxID=231223 RepID=A0AAE0Z7Y6_9GAST|nr:hypothetical protein RRG08_055634 [Elysia crispata]
MTSEKEISVSIQYPTTDRLLERFQVQEEINLVIPLTAFWLAQWHVVTKLLPLENGAAVVACSGINLASVPYLKTCRKKKI